MPYNYESKPNLTKKPNFTFKTRQTSFIYKTHTLLASKYVTNTSIGPREFSIKINICYLVKKSEISNILFKYFILIRD